MQPALLGCTEPLGGGILKHSRLSVSLCPTAAANEAKTQVQSRRACIASGCGASGETSSRREKRTEGLKTIPVSRVTLCHAKQPWGKPHPGSLRGGYAGPAGPPVLTHPGLGEGPDTSPRARVPQPCSPVRMVLGVEAVMVQEQPLLSPPLKKTSPMGCLPLTQLIGAKGWGETLRHNPFCLVGWPRKGPPL